MEMEIESTYYTILGVSKEANETEIKKAFVKSLVFLYYKLARTCHPDKNPDDPTAEEKFKDLSEAYQVLMDPQKREIYNKYGKKGLQTDGGEFDLAQATSQLFGLLFGGDRFLDVFGEVSICYMTRLQTDEEIVRETNEERQNQLIQEKLDAFQQKRVEHLVYKLLIKIEPYVQQAPGWQEVIQADIQEKLEAPGGAALLTHLGWVYIQEAQQHLDRWFGLQSIVQRVVEKGHVIVETVSLIKDAVKLQSAQRRMEQNGLENPEATSKAIKHGLSTMWKMGKLEIEKTVRLVCEMVLRDSSLDSQQLRRRAKGIEELGRMYYKAGNQALCDAERSKREQSKGHSAKSGMSAHNLHESFM